LPKTDAKTGMELLEPAGGHFLKEIACLKISYGKEDFPLTYKLILYYYNKRLVVTDIDGQIIDRIELFLTPKEIVQINFRKIKSQRKKSVSIGELTFDCGISHDEIVPEMFIIFIEDNELIVSDLSEKEFGRVLLETISGPIIKIDFFEKEYRKKQS